jgi:16S rRNA (guanine527-N7)-methyltransferase
MPQPALASLIPLLKQHGIGLSEPEQAAIVSLVELLERWNRHIALTGARDRGQILIRHILDSLMAETLPWPPSSLTGPVELADVGSGAGLPGLLLALRHPDCRVTSLDTVAKKITFQTEAARVLGLGNFLPLRRDVFDFAATEGRHRFHVVTARAFAELKVLLPLALELLRPGGELWAYKGAKAEEEEAEVPVEDRVAFDPVRRYPYRFDAVDWGGVILVYRKR